MCQYRLVFPLSGGRGGGGGFIFSKEDSPLSCRGHGETRGVVLGQAAGAGEKQPFNVRKGVWALLGFSGKTVGTARRKNWVGGERQLMGYLGGNLFLSGNSRKRRLAILSWRRHRRTQRMSLQTRKAYARERKPPRSAAGRRIRALLLLRLLLLLLPLLLPALTLQATSLRGSGWVRRPWKDSSLGDAFLGPCRSRGNAPPSALGGLCLVCVKS